MSNLYKTAYMNIGDDKRVIDMNELVQKRIESLGLKMQSPENAGFVDDLYADSAGVEQLVEGSDDPSGFEPGLSGILSDDVPMPDGEESEGFSGNVIKGETHINTQAMLDAAHAEAERIIDAARDAASKMEEKAQQKADGIYAEAKTNGYNEGFAEGKEAAAREMQDAREALDRERAELEEMYQKRLNDMEPELVEVITDVYEHVLNTDLKLHKTLAGHLVANALRNIDGARSFLIHISRDNFDYVNSRKSQLEEAVMVPGSVVEIVEDIALPPDSCMIETDGGIFDCSLGTELSELSSRLRMLSYSRN